MIDVSPPSATERLDGQNNAAAQVHSDESVSQLREELAAARNKIANLELALTSNRRIGAATGILMYRHKITDDQAFELLRAASQISQRKLRDVAEEVLATGAITVPHGLHKIHSGTRGSTDGQVGPGG